MHFGLAGEPGEAEILWAFWLAVAVEACPSLCLMCLRLASASAGSRGSGASLRPLPPASCSCLLLLLLLPCPVLHAASTPHLSLPQLARKQKSPYIAFQPRLLTVPGGEQPARKLNAGPTRKVPLWKRPEAPRCTQKHVGTCDVVWRHAAAAASLKLVSTRLARNPRLLGRLF